jgi:hypothetical protein
LWIPNARSSISGNSPISKYFSSFSNPLGIWFKRSQSRSRWSWSCPKSVSRKWLSQTRKRIILTWVSSRWYRAYRAMPQGISL